MALFSEIHQGEGREVAAVRGQLARAESMNENYRREIEMLMEQLDEKENRITTPKSSRERTPQNHGRLRLQEQHPL